MIWDDLSRTGFSKHFPRLENGESGGVTTRSSWTSRQLNPDKPRAANLSRRPAAKSLVICGLSWVRGEPASIVPAIRQAIWSIDKDEPITRVQTVEEIVGRQLSEPSQDTVLLGAFALLALSLASLGLYGVLSYAVTQRTNEIGVRMALGATSNDILLSFGGRGLGLTLAGLAIGLVLAAIAARLMTVLLYGFRPDYVPAVAVVSLILLGVAALACFVPARRAACIDPVVALRHE
jgi:putative ABC transport system permease protein